jgi:hypothetical protein
MFLYTVTVRVLIFQNIFSLYTVPSHSKTQVVYLSTKSPSLFSNIKLICDGGTNVTKSLPIIEIYKSLSVLELLTWTEIQTDRQTDEISGCNFANNRLKCAPEFIARIFYI